MATLTQSHFRFGKDDGTESTHTFWQLEDINHSQEITANWTFLLRFCEQVTTAISNVDAQFQYNKNAAGWVNITTTSSVVKAVAVNAFTDGQACTKRLSGTGTFETSGAGCTEDGLSGGSANDIVLNGNSETEAGLQVVFADVVNGDTIQFRLTSPDATMSYAVTPTLTIVIAGLTAVEDTIQKIWNIRQAVPDTTQFVYNVKALTSDTVQPIWNVKTVISDAIQHIWNVKGVIGDTIQQVWHIHSLTTKTVQLIHNVKTVISDTSQYIWNVLAGVPVSDAVQFVWHIKTSIEDTLQQIWNARSVIGKPSEYVWHIRQNVSRTGQALWNILTSIGKTNEYRWNLRQVVEQSKQALWNCLSAFISVEKTCQFIWDYSVVRKTLQALWGINIRLLSLFVSQARLLTITSNIWARELTVAGSFSSPLTITPTLSRLFEISGTESRHLTVEVVWQTS